jgi:hypothetical protein
MGYKQHNNPFGKIISPLKHNVRTPGGKTWDHSHMNSGKVRGTVERGRLIRGDEDFNKRTNRAVRDERTGSKKLPDGSRATSENYAREYARQLADYYNKGYITGGNFLAQEFNKKKGKLNFFKKGNLVDYKGGKKSISLPGMYNMTAAEAKNVVVPDNQYSEDDIYEMMVQGNGLVSIVDGKIVAGNPNEIRNENDLIRERVGDEGTKDERGRRSYDPNWTPEGYEVFNEDKRTVREILAERKGDPINMMKNSPLQSNHGTDERSNNEQEGYDYIYRPDENVTTTERVELDDGGYKIITRIVTPGTGTQIIEEPGDQGGDGGGSGSGEGFYNPNIPDQTWDEWVEAPCPSPGKDRQAGDKYCPPKTDDVEIVNVSEEIFPPDEPDPEPEPELVDVNFDLGQGSIKRDDFSIDLPEINLPDLGLDRLRILQKKCGRCKQRGLIQRAILALGGGI